MSAEELRSARIDASDTGRLALLLKVTKKWNKSVSLSESFTPKWRSGCWICCPVRRDMADVSRLETPRIRLRYAHKIFQFRCARDGNHNSRKDGITMTVSNTEKDHCRHCGACTRFGTGIRVGAKHGQKCTAGSARGIDQGCASGSCAPGSISTPQISGIVGQWGIEGEQHIVGIDILLFVGYSGRITKKSGNNRQGIRRVLLVVTDRLYVGRSCPLNIA